MMEIVSHEAYFSLYPSKGLPSPIFQLQVSRLLDYASLKILPLFCAQVNSKAPLKDMGKVNGASQAAASFVRAIGPALGGVLWGLSVSIPIRGHQLLAFSIAAVGYIAPLFVFGFVKAPRMAEAPPAAH